MTQRTRPLRLSFRGQLAEERRCSRWHRQPPAPDLLPGGLGEVTVTAQPRADGSGEATDLSGPEFSQFSVCPVTVLCLMKGLLQP